MRNHDEKIKDISRSVLPSTGRKSARDTRRLVHKRPGWPPARRPMPRRPLLGAHDARAFAEEMASYRDASEAIASVAALAKRTPFG
jgi:hypothetical protein